MTRADIEEIRGVAVSSEIVKTLLNREWVKIVGHRDVPGKPALLGTTNGFLEHFNLGSLNDLPPLSEIRDVETIAMELNFTPEENTHEQTRQDSENGESDNQKRSKSPEVPKASETSPPVEVGMENHQRETADEALGPQKGDADEQS